MQLRYLRRILLVSVSTLVGACGESQQASTVKPQIIVQLPAATDVSGLNSMRCTGLIDMGMTGSYDKSLANGLEASVSTGQNNAAVSIEDARTLRFLSGAGFDAGTAKGAAFDIVVNNREELVATHFDGSSLSTFALNKQNGLAIWSKVRSTFPGYEAPTGGYTYLSCK